MLRLARCPCFSWLGGDVRGRNRPGEMLAAETGQNKLLAAEMVSNSPATLLCGAFASAASSSLATLLLDEENCGRRWSDDFCSMTAEQPR